MNKETEDKSDFAKKAEFLSQQSVNSFLNEAHNTAIDNCIEVVKELYAVQISTDSDGYTYHNHPVPTEKYLTEKLQSLKK